MEQLKEREELAVFQLPERTPPIYQGGTSLEEHADAWETVDRSLQNHYWYLGAIAASLDRSYGRGSIKELAEQVGKSPERVYQLLHTYKAFDGKDVSGQLTFTHFQYAADSDDPDYWIRRAHEEGLSTRKLLELIKGKALPEFRLHEPEPVQDVEVRPVTESGYSSFPPDEAWIEPGQVSEQAEQVSEQASISYPKRSLKAWYGFITSFNCLACGSSDVEVAHIEAVLSNRTSGWLPRRVGLAEWACIPLCHEHHQTAIDSIHAIGEDAFCENLRSIKYVHDWLITRLLEFFTE